MSGRKRLRISRADYDKSFRCPGWSGSGLTWNAKNWCDDPELPGGVRRWPQARYDARRSMLWRIDKTNCCNTIVLPIALRVFEWRWWDLRLRFLVSDLRYAYQRRQTLRRWRAEEEG